MHELSDRRRRRERFWHQSKADLGKADIEGRVIDSAPRPIDQAKAPAAEKHVAGPEVTVNERQTLGWRWPVLVQPVDDQLECRLTAERRLDRPKVPAFGDHLRIDSMTFQCASHRVGIDTPERTDDSGQPAWPRRDELRQIEHEARRLDASQVGPMGQPLHDQVPAVDPRSTCLPQQQPGSEVVGSRNGVQSCLEARLLRRPDDAEHELAGPSLRTGIHREGVDRREPPASEGRGRTPVPEPGGAELSAKTLQHGRSPGSRRRQHGETRAHRRRRASGIPALGAP